MKRELVSGSNRTSNIEFLRILMMLSLIAHHFVVNSGITELYEFNISFNMVFAQIFAMWGKTAINVFTIITGYYMVKSTLTWKKLIKLYGTAAFYIIGFTIFFMVIGYEIFSIKNLVRTCLFLVYEAGTLYTGTMIIMMLFVPFINILVRNMSKCQYRFLLFLLLAYFTGSSTFFKHDTFDFVFWMMTAYLIGGYIRLYPGKWDSRWAGMIGSIISITAMIISIICIDIWGPSIGITSYYYFLSDANKLLAVTTAIFVFIMFKNWKLNYNKTVNVIASATFGTLLFHANSDVMRKFLWKDVFNNAGHFYDKSFPIYACIVVLLVYVIGCLL